MPRNPEEDRLSPEEREDRERQMTFSAPVDAMKQVPTPGPLSGDDTALVATINYLRADEGDTVSLLCDNPDFNGQPSNAVECNGGWTDWVDKRFSGDSLFAALNNAALAKAVATKTLAPTAPVEASGSERALQDAVDFGVGFLVDGQRVSPERVTVCHGDKSPLRPQPSGETREIARWDICLDDSGDSWEAYEDPTGEWVKYADVETLLSARPAPVAETAGEAVGVVSGCARADLYTADLPTGTLLYAAPVPAQDDDKLRILADRVTAEVKRGADGSHVQALGALSNIEGLVLAALKSEGK